MCTFGMISARYSGHTDVMTRRYPDDTLIRDSGLPGAAVTMNREESQRSEATESATIEGGDDAASPSAHAAPSLSKPDLRSDDEHLFVKQGRVSVDGEQPEDANAGGETSNRQGKDMEHLNKDSEKSLSLAFDNLLKLLQSPATELAQNTSELLELLTVQPAGANTGLSPGGTHLLEEDMAPETQAESWHDAPASLSTTVIPAL